MGRAGTKTNQKTSKQQTPATSTIGGVVGWDGLGQKQTKRHQTADAGNIDHRRGGGMGWAGTITNQTTADTSNIDHGVVGTRSLTLTPTRGTYHHPAQRARRSWPIDLPRGRSIYYPSTNPCTNPYSSHLSIFLLPIFIPSLMYLSMYTTYILPLSNSARSTAFSPELLPRGAWGSSARGRRKERRPRAGRRPRRPRQERAPPGGQSMALFGLSAAEVLEPNCAGEQTSQNIYLPIQSSYPSI